MLITPYPSKLHDIIPTHLSTDKFQVCSFCESNLLNLSKSLPIEQKMTSIIGSMNLVISIMAAFRCIIFWRSDFFFIGPKKKGWKLD